MKTLALVLILTGCGFAQDAGSPDRTVTDITVPNKPRAWRGTLVDAGCKDRSVANLRKSTAAQAATPPDNAAADQADTPNGSSSRDGAQSAQGVTVDSATAQAERSDAMKTHTADHLTRQMDPSCAVTADTSSFALLLPNGTLLNLDEGGNTKAFAAFQASPQGKKILNGDAPGRKPGAIITGTRVGDALTVVDIRLQ